MKKLRYPKEIVLGRGHPSIGSYDARVLSSKGVPKRLNQKGLLSGKYDLILRRVGRG